MVSCALTVTDLGLDILENILARLQVKDLLLCKAVCKSRNCLISTPCFTKSHLDYILNNKRDDTRIMVSNGASSMCVDQCHYSRLGECHLVGSCNGVGVCTLRICAVRYIYPLGSCQAKHTQTCSNKTD